MVPIEPEMPEPSKSMTVQLEKSVQIETIAQRVNGGAGRPTGAFVDIEKLRNAEGLVAIISQRRSNAQVTVSILKEFERDGKIETTSFIGENLFDAYESMLKAVRQRVTELRATGALPIKQAG